MSAHGAPGHESAGAMGDAANAVAMAMATGAAHVATDGRIVWANAALAGLIGVPLADIIGADFNDAVRTIGLDRDALFGAQQRHVEALVLHGHGEPFVGRLAACPIRTPPGFAFTLTDLSEIRTDDAVAEAKRAAEAKARSAFASVISHELKTPLNGILGSLSLLQRNGDGSERLIGALRKSSVRLLHMLEDVIEFALVDDEPAARAEVDSARLADWVRAAHAERVEGAGQTLVVADTVAGTLWMNADVLLAAAGRVIDNAVKVSPKGATIRVTLSQGWRDERTQFALAIEDEGPGFPEDRVEMLFEGFNQADKSPTRPYEGLGLGLALVKQGMRRLGGRISVERAKHGGALLTLIVERAFPESA